MPKNNTFQKPGFWKKKSLGQNFLINRSIFDKILNASELNREDTIIEIGPGTGNLTEKLSERVRRVIAVEKDSRLISFLREKFTNSNIEIVEGDILHIGANISRSRASGEYKIIGNIPYYITSHILRAILEQWRQPKLIVFMVQKEVAKRIIAKPPEMSLLALSIQFYSNPEIIGYVSKGSFRPIPRVDSAIIKFAPKKDADHQKIESALKLARKAFAGKRKQLQNTLPEINFESMGINPQSRPEELNIYDWLKMW